MEPEFLGKDAIGHAPKYTKPYVGRYELSALLSVIDAQAQSEPKVITNETQRSLITNDEIRHQVPYAWRREYSRYKGTKQYETVSLNQLYLDPELLQHESHDNQHPEHIPIRGWPMVR